MRPPLLACLVPLAFAAAAAHAEDGKRPQVSSQQCGFGTPFNVLADSGGIWLYRDDGAPREIFFHDGELSVDRQVRTVSDADAQRLRQMEAGTRALMPQVAGLARDTVDVVFDALGGVAEALTGSARKARQLERHRKQTLDYVDGTLGKGRWDQEVFDDKFEARIEEAAEEFSGSMARSVLWQVFTGRAGRMEERADRMDEELERKLDARSKQIEASADALCTQVATLHDLQESLEYRYDGTPLRMLEVSQKPQAQDDDKPRSAQVRVDD